MIKLFADSTITSASLNFMLKQTALCLLVLLLSSCWGIYNRPSEPTVETKVLGYKPVYSNDSSLLQLQVLSPQQVKYPGKIYVKGTLIFQNELGRGIHVIDNADPSTAKKIGFIRLLGNTEMSIKGNHLYANSYSDLVTIDISDWQNVIEVKRVRQAFSQGNSAHSFNFIPLPERGVYYECSYNVNKGIQTGWIKDSILIYNCYYN